MKSLYGAKQYSYLDILKGEVHQLAAQENALKKERPSEVLYPCFFKNNTFLQSSE